MKISIKPFEDYYKKFGEVNIDMKAFKKRYKNICYKNHKVIHHDHSKRENNIIDYICNNCNWKIKNKKELVMLFHNAKSYDNKYMLDIFSKIENIKIKVVGHNQDKFKMIEFRIPGKDYCLKIIDSLSFLQSNLNNLSKEVYDEFKIITKEHFGDNFEMVNKKLENFPYDYLKTENLLEEKLPNKKEFYDKMILSHINENDYNSVKKFYKDMNFKILKEYLQCYLKSDIFLLADCFLNFRNIVFDEYGLDCCKYISAPSLSKDCCLKYSKAKIENIMDIDVFNFVKKAISGRFSNSISPYEKIENENQSIVMMDIASQYSCETAKNIPIGNYRFVQRLDENRYGQDKDYGCILLCDVKTTDEIKNDLLQKQIPMLFSKVKITDKNLSEYQINQIREKINENENEKIEYRTQAEKLISHLGNDENNYMSFEMYQMMKDAGYDIEIKAILEYKHKAVFTGYIESLYEKKDSMD